MPIRYWLTLLIVAPQMVLLGCQSVPKETSECYRLTYATGRVHEVCRQGNSYSVRDIEGQRRPNAESALKRSLDTVRNIEDGLPID
ncbi:hypothetical protein GRZ55_22735 [Chelativorans sp. ZYF759]|uniref:hypothetical protein n=1 Tax=Chelativorans sp. ZYF759 TaxID=2692213 RepID=UPI00145CB7DC|nr:hypothetical protein [Chelativorans sp. ZYF759]NMG42041.1 hypothetical protein [Chelativorans sp. ZYF759]